MDRELEELLSQLKRVLSIGQARGWPAPDGHTDAVALSRAATELISTPAPADPPLPTKPGDVPKWVMAVAAARRNWSDSRKVAEEVHEAAERALGRSIQDAVPDLITRIVAEFDAQADTFTQLIATAPRTLTGHESADELEQHAELLRLSSAMSRTVVDRGQLAVASGESADLGPQGVPWLFLKPGPDSYLEAIEVALRDTAIPTTIDEWAQMHRIGIAGAREGEAAHRMQQFAIVRNQRGMQPHGGVQDERYGAMLDAAQATGAVFTGDSTISARPLTTRNVVAA